MSKTANVNIRMDAELKREAEILFNELGLNMTTAFNMFIRQSLYRRGIPFEVALKTPNAETVAAMEEADRISSDPNVKGFDNLDDLFEELRA